MPNSFLAATRIGARLPLVFLCWIALSQVSSAQDAGQELLDEGAYIGDVLKREPSEPFPGRSVFHREFFECVAPGLPKGWEVDTRDVTGLDPGAEVHWNPTTWVVVRDESSPGAEKQSLRLSGPVSLNRMIRPRNRVWPCILSAFMRADQDGVRVTFGTTKESRAIELTKTWERYSITTEIGEVPRWKGFQIRITGPPEGTAWVSGIQAEHPPAAQEERARHWERSSTFDYEIDAAVARSGENSFRLTPAILRTGLHADVMSSASGAAQVVKFVASPGKAKQPGADSGLDSIIIAGWAKCDDIPKDYPDRYKRFKRERSIPLEGLPAPAAFIKLEVWGPPKKWEEILKRYRRRNKWTIMRAKREAQLPDQVHRIRFEPDTAEWTRKQLVVRPKRVPVSKIRVVLECSGTEGRAWFDDIVLARLPKTEDQELEFELQPLDNLLKNPGGEEVETIEVRRFDAKPSPLAEPRPVPRSGGACELLPLLPELTATKTGEPPAIDGQVTDACWKDAAPTGPFVELVHGHPELYGTQARACRDESHLYVSFTWDESHEGAPGDIVPTFGVFLKPQMIHPDRTFYDFRIDVNGNRTEAIGFEHRFGPGVKYFDGGLEEKKYGYYEEWEKPWKGAVQRKGDTLTAEFAIPITSVRLNLDTPFWGLNLYLRRRDGQFFAWNPTYSSQGDRNGAWPWLYAPRRTNGTDSFYRRLHGMAGLRAPTPYEGMLRIEHAGLERQVDGSVGIVVRADWNIRLPVDSLEVEVAASLSKPGAKTPGNQAAAVTLKPGSNVLRITGFAAKWEEHGVYRLNAVVKTKAGELILSRLPKRFRTRVLGPRYNCRIARARIRAQLLYFAPGEVGRVLVESGLREPATVSFRLMPDGNDEAKPVEVIGEKVIAPGQKRYLALDLSGLPLGIHLLDAAFTNKQGEVVARATDEVRLLEPKPYGVPLNRVTGLFRWRGKWQILRATFKGSNFIIGYTGSVAKTEELSRRAEALGDEFGAVPWFANHDISEARAKGIVEVVRQVREDPRIVLYKLVDEPRLSDALGLQFYRWAREADPHRVHTGLGCFGRPGVGEDGTYRATDLFLGGGYPFGLGRVWKTPWNFSLEHDLQNYVEWGKDTTERGMPISTWVSTKRGGHSEGRPPTPEEMRAHLYGEMIHNVRVFQYWGGMGYHKPLADLVSEIHSVDMRIIEDFLGEEETLPLYVGRRDYVHVALWQNRNGLMLVAVNALPFTLTTQLPVATMARSPMASLKVARSHNAEATLENGTVHLTMKKLGTAILMMTE